MHPLKSENKICVSGLYRQGSSKQSNGKELSLILDTGGCWPTKAIYKEKDLYSSHPSHLD